jgi:mono/diheme cytochrome c family protein
MKALPFTTAILSLFAAQFLSAAETLPSSERPTFNKHIAPLVFEHCASCHRPGEVAPFSLLTYSDVKKRAGQIAELTSKRFMPPWKSVEGHGRFIGERRLSQDQIDLIARWVSQGSIEGDSRDLPATPKFNDSWTLGQPDIVLTMAEPYPVPADGPDVYRNFILKLEIPSGKYIKALEYRPSNRRVVHHALFASDATGKARKDDEADPLPGFQGSLNIPGRLFPGSMSAWAPGREARPLPDDISMPWNNKADLILQLHLHPSGKPEVEQSTIGFYLTDEPPSRSMVDVMLLDNKIDIPPGEAAFRTRDEFSIPVEMEVLALFPHMHLIGRDFRITAVPPTGEPFDLIWINDWDFNWQSLYQCEPSVRLPANTKIVLEALHDNSVANIRNPSNPPRRVTFGEETSNEMTAALIQFVPVHEADLAKMTEANKRRIVSAIKASAK